MKKFFLILLIVLSAITCLTAVACKKDEGLKPYISQLRSNIYVSESKNYDIKAYYGFKETPFINDGKVGEKIYALTFYLNGDKTSDAAYTVTFNYNDTEYTKAFTRDISHKLSAELEIENFNESKFSAIIKKGSSSEEIEFKSALPEKTITYAQALESLEKNQPELISTFYNEQGEFTAEIYLRVLLKENTPYWYVGFATGNERIKALLINGFSGEVLAIREVL